MKMSHFIFRFFFLFLVLFSFNSFADDAEKKSSNTSSISKIALMPDFSDLVEELLPAVVNISTTQEITGKVSIDQALLNDLPKGSVFDNLKELLENQQPQKRKLSSLGSGFLISKDGYIATNSHVIEDADEIMVSLSNGKKFKAKVIGVDKKTDLALLKIDADDLKYVKMGDSDKARIGEWIITIGNPFGLGGSVSVGIISARGRDIAANQTDDFIQTDAAINKGNSGGPLFNMKGEVLGIATAIFSPSGGSVGIGFATPINNASAVIKQLKEKGEVVRGWLGVAIQDVTKEIADSIGMEKEKGAFVMEVMKDSPAESAGLLPTDIIIKFDGRDIEEMKDLPKIVAATSIDKKVKLIVLRQGKEKTLTTKIKKLKQESASKKDDSVNKDLLKKPTSYLLGMGLVEIDKKSEKKNKTESNLKSELMIVDLKSDIEAGEPGIKVGDVILSSNQEEVASISDLEKIIEKSKKLGHKSLLLMLKRDETKFVVTLKLQ